MSFCFTRFSLSISHRKNQTHTCTHTHTHTHTHTTHVYTIKPPDRMKRMQEVGKCLELPCYQRSRCSNSWQSGCPACHGRQLALTYDYQYVFQLVRMSATSVMENSSIATSRSGRLWTPEWETTTTHALEVGSHSGVLPAWMIICVHF